MAVRIDSVEAGSRAARAGIQAGDVLVSINGHDIVDVLDYRFFETERELRLCLTRGGEPYQLELVKPQYASLGLEFATYLMDEQRSCRNKCIFCFIDQLPKGMRETLYFKDDDDRLSFLFGNYITLTNIDDREVDRILQMRISPSMCRCTPWTPAAVQDDAQPVRGGLPAPPVPAGGGGHSAQLPDCAVPRRQRRPRLGAHPAGVLVPGGGAPQRGLCAGGPHRYREGLYPLEPYNQKTAGEVLDLLEQWGNKWKEERGARTVYASDELYLLAGRPIPPLEFYEDFPQIENGVGMLRNLQDEFDWALEDLELPDSPRHVTIPTGECGFRFLDQLLDGLRQKCHNITIDLIPVKNDFFGGTVNVTGLLTGQDILKNLKGRDLGDEVLLATNMMRAGEDIFLDDMTREDLSASLGVPCRRVGSTGEALVCAICGLPQPDTPGLTPMKAPGSTGSPRVLGRLAVPA